MKLIRDIINEKRANSKAAAAAAPIAPDAPQEPLMLKTPLPAAATDKQTASAPDFNMFEAGFSADFFKKVASQADDAAPRSASPSAYQDEYEEEYESAPDTASDLHTSDEQSAFDDDDDDYDDDDDGFDPDFYAYNEDTVSDLDDFAPSVTENGSPLMEPKSDPFDRLNASHDQTANARPIPSPLKQSVSARPMSQPRSVEELMSGGVESSEFEADAAEDNNDMEPVDMPAPTVGRSSGRSGRVKTRLLGFSAASIEQTDPFAKEESKADGTFPVGWLVVVSELGRGSAYSLYDGVSKIGRGTDQTVSLNFGDNSISRENHISIAYDAEQNKFFIGHSGKTNLVRVNNTPLLSTQELFSKDLIRLGETTLRFVALCQQDFTWNEAQEPMVRHA